MIKQFAALLILMSISTSIIKAQTPWTVTDKAAYMANKQDSATWDLKLLQDDIEFKYEDDNEWPTKPAISNYPSPVPKYDWGYGFIGSVNIEVSGKTLKGVTVGFAKDKYRNHLLKDTSDLYINYFNIFIWSDLKDEESSANSIISRNYPHYLSTGKQKTTMGAIDWMHMNLADGQNFAVIAQSYFDLNFGKTILVIPLKDGSLRMLQIDDEIGSIKVKEVTSVKKESRLNPKFEFLERLAINPKIIAFLNDNRLLE